MAGADPRRAAVAGLLRPVAGGFHRNDAAARLRRRSPQSDRRQSDPHRPRHRHRHPDRDSRRHLYGRIWPLRRAHQRGCFINDILLSAPSIVVGLFIYEVMVAPMRHFSGLASGVALAVLVIPVVVRTTEDMLTLVPNALREAATSIGLPRSLAITRICYRAARAGMLTGVLLAVARISGETPPLLFTSLNNQFWSTNLNAPISSLPVVIFQFALSPYKDWQA